MRVLDTNAACRVAALQFGLGGLFMQRARDYHCLTPNAEEADLFLVPAFSYKTHNRPTERNAESESAARALGGHLRAFFTRLRRIRVSRCNGSGDGEGTARSNCSALAARGGADHILINPRNGAEFERHPLSELDYMDPRLGNATLLDLMEPGDWPWYGNYRTEPRYHSVPHPSLVHLEVSSEGLPWRSTHARSTLVVGAFGVAHGPKQVVALRLALQQACDAAPRHLCTFHRLGGHGTTLNVEGAAGSGAVAAKGGAGGGTPAAGGVREAGWHSIARLYWNGTFCLQPPGDAVSRKACRRVCGL